MAYIGKNQISIAALLASTTLLAPAVSANHSQWANTGDPLLRHHLEVLSSANLISVPLTTWPLNWSGIDKDLDKIRTDSISKKVKNSLDYILKLQRRNQRGSANSKISLAASNGDQWFNGFETNSRDSLETQWTTDWSNGRFAGSLSVGVNEGSLSDHDLRLDGSYLSATYGNWIFSAGRYDRWWGPGWSQSVALSNNARPMPSIALQRNYSDAPESSWFNWIGPWQLSTFMGQFEDERVIPDAKLFGLRITFKPAESVEVGLTRTAQWGGEGRPENFDSVLNMLRGQDNIALEFSVEEGRDVPEEGARESDASNQMAGFDVQWSKAIRDGHLSLYTQFIGDDESSKMPASFVGVFGASYAFNHDQASHRFTLEYTDTTSDFHSSQKPNFAYEHFIYKTGFRYHQRNVAASIDSDSNIIKFQGLHHYTKSATEITANWSIASINLNEDGTLPGKTTVNYLSSTSLSFEQLEAGLSFTKKRLQYGINGVFRSEEFDQDFINLPEIQVTLNASYLLEL